MGQWSEPRRFFSPDCRESITCIAHLETDAFDKAQADTIVGDVILLDDATLTQAMREQLGAQARAFVGKTFREWLGGFTHKSADVTPKKEREWRRVAMQSSPLISPSPFMNEFQFDGQSIPNRGWCPFPYCEGDTFAPCGPWEFQIRKEEDGVNVYVRERQ